MIMFPIAALSAWDEGEEILEEEIINIPSQPQKTAFADSQVPSSVSLEKEGDYSPEISSSPLITSSPPFASSVIPPSQKPIQNNKGKQKNLPASQTKAPRPEQASGSFPQTGNQSSQSIYLSKGKPEPSQESSGSIVETNNQTGRAKAVKRKADATQKTPPPKKPAPSTQVASDQAKSNVISSSQLPLRIFISTCFLSLFYFNRGSIDILLHSNVKQPSSN